MSKAKKNKQSASLMMIPIIIIGLLVSIYLVSQSQELRKRAAGTGAILSISPANVTVAAGQTSSIGVTMNTGGDLISAAELHLTFDPTKITVQSISAGSPLPVVLTAGAVGSGTVSIVLGSQPSAPFQGTGIIATITFKALTVSTTQVNFAATTQAAAVGKMTNDIQTMTGGQVTVSGGTVPSPTPQKTPTPSPKVSTTPQKTPTPLPTQANCLRKSSGDADCNGIVNGVDYSLWLNSQCHPGAGQQCAVLKADFNGDGNVDDRDYAVWYANRT